MLEAAQTGIRCEQAGPGRPRTSPYAFFKPHVRASFLATLLLAPRLPWVCVDVLCGPGRPEGRTLLL